MASSTSFGIAQYDFPCSRLQKNRPPLSVVTMYHGVASPPTRTRTHDNGAEVEDSASTAQPGGLCQQDCLVFEL